MNYQEYTQGVLETENRDFDSIRGRMTDQTIRLLHGAIGLNTEVSELFEADFDDKPNLVEELGDASFYQALILDCLKINITWLNIPQIDFDSASSSEEKFTLALESAAFHANEILDMCKKIVFYGKELDVHFFNTHLSHFHAGFVAMCKLLETTPQKVWSTNNKKLALRYKKKFSNESALKRDLDGERALLEENSE
jgi:hypothetical protein